MKEGSRILLPDDAFHCFWSPSLIFDNNKDGKHFFLSVPNTLVAIYSNKTVLKASRYVQPYPLLSQMPLAHSFLSYTFLHDCLSVAPPTVSMCACDASNADRVLTYTLSGTSKANRVKRLLAVPCVFELRVTRLPWSQWRLARELTATH